LRIAFSLSSFSSSSCSPQMQTRSAKVVIFQMKLGMSWLLHSVQSILGNLWLLKVS